MGSGVSKPAFQCDRSKMKGCLEQHNDWKDAKREREVACLKQTVDEYNRGNGVIGGGAAAAMHLMANNGCQGMQLRGPHNR